MRRWMLMIIATLLVALTTKATAEDAVQKLELAPPFTDNMILQRQSKVPVWGFDKPGSQITVEFAGQKKSAVTDKMGDWRVDLDTLEASAEEREFKVDSSRGTSVTLKGVLVGEVWFASGQSNMVWTTGKSMVSSLARDIAKAPKDLPIREINVNTVSALYPKKKATSENNGWKRSKDVGGFSALSLSFAYELHKELNVPVGILLSAHSNTRIEAFAQRQGFEVHPGLKVDVDLMHDGDVLTEQGHKAFQKYYHDIAAWQKAAITASQAGTSLPRRPELPGIAGMWRGPSQFFNGKISPVVPYAVRGALWCQGEANSDDGLIYASRMEALVNGWRNAWGMPDMPFYFTQMQPYGSPGPESGGFADIRQVQFEFFLKNRKNVGMVVQTDLNQANPGGIHYSNKLHPGMRLARWALAKQYGKDIPYTGPIYEGYKADGDKVIVSFEKDSLFGGLMVGSKGMEKDSKNPDGYVEPARPTPDAKLNHFRLCGENRKWFAADAVIQGDTVVVTSKDVPKPVGVQYAYNAAPENCNLYNKAGLPATPFAAVNGQLIFQKTKASAAAVTVETGEVDGDAKTEEAPKPARKFLHVAEYYRDGVVVQREKPILVWGHAAAGAKVTVKLGDSVQTTEANPLEQWSVALPAMKATIDPISLVVEAGEGVRREVKNIRIGDVWFLTGTSMITSNMAQDSRAKDAPPPEALPLVYEFKRNTKASTNSTPRKRGFETGGGKYRSRWLPADYAKNPEGVTQFAYEFAKALNRPGVPQGFVSMSGGGKDQRATPLSWTSYAGVKHVKHPAFEPWINEILLQYPESEVARKAFDKYIVDVTACEKTILDIAKAGGDLSLAPQQFPGFPAPGGSAVPGDLVPTYTYNWCISPMTPMAVAGVIWIPSDYNISPNPADYAAELEIYAKSLPETYGQNQIEFIYAQPSAKLVKGITAPAILDAKSVTFDAWPKSLKELAIQMAETQKK